MKTLYGVASCLAVTCAFVACSSDSDSGASGDVPPVTEGTDAAVQPGEGGTTPTPGPDASAPDATVEPFGAIGIALSASTITIKQARSATLDVTVTRPPGVTGPVDLDVNGLPAGASAKTVRVEPGATSGTLTIDAAELTPQGLSTATVVATSGARSDGAAALSVNVIGRPGTLDTSYGIAGRRFHPAPTFSSVPTVAGLALDATGASVFCVSGLVTRIGTDGSRDMTYGTAGSASVPGNWPKWITVDNNGRTVIGYRATSGGSNTSTAGVARLTAVGTPDTTFNTTGVLGINWSSPINAFGDNVESVGVEPDNSLVVAGDRNTSQSGSFIYSRISVIRVLENGLPDATFTRYDAPYNSYGPKVARAPDGSWVVASKSGQVFRLTSTGALDTTFHGGTPASGTAGGLIVLADGKILWGSGGSMGKLLVNGDPDTTFGTNGIFTIPANGPAIANMALQSDGSIIATGGANADFATIRVLPNGNLDTDFGTNGVARTDIASVDDTGVGVRIQADGKIVVGGFSGGNAAFLRYWN
jgi:uncharacterized delta-60 repeat protein